MKGIILAGGAGSRLFPLTNIITKQLLPVYDKPMIYYPLSTLMLAGIKDILIISTPTDIGKFERLLGSGSSLGIKLCYKEQPEPKGIAQAFIIGKEFIGSDSVCLILGDNIFYGNTFIRKLPEFISMNEGAMVFGYRVKDPERYGVVEFNDKQEIINIEEKPENPKSHYAITGLYFYDNQIVEIVNKLKPSKRGELEITDVNREYLQMNKLKVFLMERGDAWLDTGTHDSLLDASNFIATVERRQGIRIGCIEGIAYEKGYISKQEFEKLISGLPGNSYREYLKSLI